MNPKTPPTTFAALFAAEEAAARRKAAQKAERLHYRPFAALTVPGRNRTAPRRRPEPRS